MGGHTVYFKLKKSAYADGKVKQEEAIIAVSKGNGLKLEGPREARK